MSLKKSEIDSLLTSLKPNDTICWANTRNYCYNWHINHNQPQDQIVIFGFTPSPDLHPATLSTSDPVSTTDLLYLMRLCQYENEYVQKFKKLKKLNQHVQVKSFADNQMETSRYIDFRQQSMHPEVNDVVDKNKLMDLRSQIDSQTGLIMGSSGKLTAASS